MVAALLHWVAGKPVGRGAYGEVYQGLYNGQMVAVKSIRHPPSKAHLVINEVQLMLRMQHPNVVHALQYVNKLTIERYQRNAGALPSGQAWDEAAVSMVLVCGCCG